MRNAPNDHNKKQKGDGSWGENSIAFGMESTARSNIRSADSRTSCDARLWRIIGPARCVVKERETASTQYWEIATIS